MICTELGKCVDCIIRKNVTTRSKKGKHKEKTETVYTGSPCADDSKAKQCIKFMDNREKPSCTENGKRYILDIGAHYFDCVCIRIDKGVLASNEVQKCDFAFFLKDTEQRVILIELKGKDVGHAIGQLHDSLQLDALKDALRGKKVYGRIACTASVPDIYTKQRMDLQKEFMRLKGNLKIGGALFVEPYCNMDKL